MFEMPLFVAACGHILGHKEKTMPVKLPLFVVVYDHVYGYQERKDVCL